MKYKVMLVSVLIVFTLSGCDSAGPSKPAAERAEPASPRGQAAAGTALPQSDIQRGSLSKDQSDNRPAAVKPVAFVPEAGEPGQATDRKIIRNAELSVQVTSPQDGQSRLTAIAESHGGFVVSSELSQSSDPERPIVTAKVVLRVPSSQFLATLEEVRGLGSRVLNQKVTGQDVTEEYVDLEARIRAKKALEDQLLGILKQARSVRDALEVQTEVSNVRTEIERLEGRRRYLDNQSAFSTLTINLQNTMPLVATTGTGFGFTVKQAMADTIDVGATIIQGIIRIVGVMIPVSLLILLPFGLLIRFLVRRLNRTSKSAPVLPEQPAPAQ